MFRTADLHELVCGTADACFVSGPDGLILDWNSAAAALFGVSAAEVVSRPCASIVQGNDSDGRCVCTIDCCLRQLALDNKPIHSFDLEVKTASGARRWVNISIIVVAEASGKRLLIHLCRDINHRKKLENVTERFLSQIGILTGRQVEELITPARPPHLILTNRERQVLHLIALGRSSKEIGRELKISTATVRNHTQQVLHKLGAHSRTEAVHLADREHLT
jgi:PAS domain S-box-containing protein